MSLFGVHRAIQLQIDGWGQMQKSFKIRTNKTTLYKISSKRNIRQAIEILWTKEPLWGWIWISKVNINGHHTIEQSSGTTTIQHQRSWRANKWYTCRVTSVHYSFGTHSWFSVDRINCILTSVSWSCPTYPSCFGTDLFFFCNSNLHVATIIPSPAISHG